MMIPLLFFCSFLHASNPTMILPSENGSPDSTLLIIADTAVSREKLIEALRQLGDKPTTSQFWNNIAGDPRYSGWHRKEAVIQLFKRHVSAGMSLYDLFTLFRGERWFRESSISVVNNVFGLLPLALFPDRTICCIQVLNKEGSNPCSIYFSFKPQVSSQEFMSLIENPDNLNPACRDLHVCEVGYSSELLAGYNKPW